MGLGDFILYKNMERKFEVRGLVSFSFVVRAFLEACILASSFDVSPSALSKDHIDRKRVDGK